MSYPVDSELFVARGKDLRSFEKQVVIDAPVSRVFDAWTTGDGWLSVYAPDRPQTRANIELAIGGRYEWLFDGVVGSNGCQVLSYIPDRMLSFSWSAPPTQARTRLKRTWVVVEFESVGDAQTRVRLTHLGFGDGEAWDETYAYFDKAWASVLDRMKTALAQP